jgi:hypothetical protein
MRSRFRSSIAVSFGVALLVAAAAGCAHPENAPDDPLESDSSALAQAGPLAGPAAKIATPSPGSKLDRQQLTALVGDAAPAAVGDPCGTIGSVCAPPINGILRECGGFTDACDSSGTEDVLPINFLCIPSASGNVCTAIAGQNQQTIPCTVPSDGRSCSTGCGGEFCAPYATVCAQETNKVRNCLSNGVCSQDSCVNQTSAQQIVGTCTRDTEGHQCTPLGGCKPPKVGLCNVVGNCACLSGQQ